MSALSFKWKDNSTKKKERETNIRREEDDTISPFKFINRNILPRHCMETTMGEDVHHGTKRHSSSKHRLLKTSSLTVVNQGDSLAGKVERSWRKVVTCDRASAGQGDHLPINVWRREHKEGVRSEAPVKIFRRSKHGKETEKREKEHVEGSGVTDLRVLTFFGVLRLGGTCDMWQKTNGWTPESYQTFTLPRTGIQINCFLTRRQWY